MARAVRQVPTSPPLVNVALVARAAPHNDRRVRRVSISEPPLCFALLGDGSDLLLYGCETRGPAPRHDPAYDTRTRAAPPHGVVSAPIPAGSQVPRTGFKTLRMREQTVRTARRQRLGLDG